MDSGHGPCLTVKELASLLRMHPQAVWRRACQGKIPGAFRVGSDWRLDPVALDKWIEELERSRNHGVR